MINKLGYKTTEMGEIPEEWEVVRLSQAADFVNGYPFKPSDWKKQGFPIIRIQNLNDPTAEFHYFDGIIDERYIVNNGDVLLSWSASLGVYIWQRGKAFLNQHIFKVLPNPKVDKTYFYYILHRAIEYLKKRVHGSTMRHFKKVELDNTVIPFPPPSEQQKIAHVLSCVDEAVQKTDEIIHETQELKKGLMQQLLTKGIGHSKFKQTEIGKVPEEWEVMRLGDCLSICQYGLSIPLSDKGQYPILRMNNFENGYVVPSDIKYVNIDEGLFNQFKVEQGDILFNRTNSYDLVGKVGIFLLKGNYTFASYLIRLRANSEKADPHFINYFLNAAFAQSRLKSMATRGVSQSNINAKNLKSLKVPRPSLPEQRKISSILIDLDEKTEKENQRKEQLEQLKKGLMQDLLTGRVRVKVN